MSGIKRSQEDDENQAAKFDDVGVNEASAQLSPTDNTRMQCSNNTSLFRRVQSSAFLVSIGQVTFQWPYL